MAQFDGQSHDQHVHAFKRLDRERISLARSEVMIAHFQGMQRQGRGIGEMATLQNEMQKKRNVKPVRRLLREAGRVIQTIKPVFTMSPISVAQFLEPGVLEFDLLLIDEASQVKPVDALGAIARAKQIVVVGDDKQLPPTRFFDKVLADDDASDDDADGQSSGDLESVLGLCTARGISQRMLRWHYRSRHHSLIAVSNREFYNSQLYVVPSPEDRSATMGLVFRHVTDGVFDRGGSATNRPEAAAVARAAIDHARQFPEKSLGIGAFSVAQRDAILDELELLRRQERDVEKFFAPGGNEPFFVKNLENIQGDERDVIFISVGYGRDASGYMAMNFGPLQTDGGERRLNVLISRAKERCEVFSSITADDIDLSRARSRGAQAFKTFLAYAQHGILDVGLATGKDFDSDFEQEVYNALVAEGYEVEPQVGVAGFFIDLAIIDSEQPGRYLLGIECDGAAYHSSRSARDRDRLREEVLNDRGWAIHRIWSTDWFHRRPEQLRKTIAAIEKAKVDHVARGESIGQRPKVENVVAKTLQRDDSPCAADSDGVISTVPYREASFVIREARPIFDVPPNELLPMAFSVVSEEGPVHRVEVARRLVTLWGGQRVSGRMMGAVNAALDLGVKRGTLTREGPFYARKDGPEVTVRNRQAAASPTLRKPDMLPPTEIRCALKRLVESHIGASMEEAIVQTSRLFGFGATSPQLRDMISRELDWLIEQGTLKLREQKLYLE